MQEDILIGMFQINQRWFWQNYQISNYVISCIMKYKSTHILDLGLQF